MIKIEIKKQDVITNSAKFESQPEAQAWLDQEEANQSFGPKEDYEIVISDITQGIEQEKIKQEAIQYLKDSDWYVIRQMDSGEPMPEDVKIKRQEARLKI